MEKFDKSYNNENKVSEESDSKTDWIKQKNENRAAAYDMLEAATKGLDNKENVMAYLDIQSRFDRYSVSNALLVAYQKPEATRLGDAKTWQKNGAYIKKGEKGIIILEPGKEYTKKDGTTVFSYNAKKVFDISQTTAKQRTYTQGNINPRMIIKAMIKTSPVPVEITNDLPEEVTAFYNPEAKKIFIRQGMNDGDIFRSLSREIAFARLDNGEYNRKKHEFAAQAISYITAVRAGYTPEPVKCVSESFSELNVKQKRASLSVIREHANFISNTIGRALNINNREHEDR